jgi:hypothetical protein
MISESLLTSEDKIHRITQRLTEKANIQDSLMSVRTSGTMLYVILTKYGIIKTRFQLETLG